MRDVLIAAYEQRRHRGGRRTKLTPGDQLLLTLQYWREYRTMAHLAYDFGLGKTTICDTITLVENVLIQDERFHLPGKKALISKENAARTLVVDVTESLIERPKKTKRVVFRQEKKVHNKNADHRRCRSAGNHLHDSRKGERSRFPIVQIDGTRDFFRDSLVGGQWLSRVVEFAQK